MFFTYRLSNCLYIPLTTFGNTITLPASRGPGFMLPPNVVAALCRVRDAEQIALDQWRQRQQRGGGMPSHNNNNNNSKPILEKWKPWCTWLDAQDGGSFPLPPLSIQDDDEENEHNNNQILPPMDYFVLDEARPSVKELLEEVRYHLTASMEDIDSIVIAGEGEPLLRLPALLNLLKGLHNPEFPLKPSLRLVTNGFIPKIYLQQPEEQPPALSNNPIKDDDDDPFERVARKLRLAGLDAISIALPTHLPDQYNAWMKPITDDDDDDYGTAHDRVCRFLRACLKEDWSVEVTAVSRPDVDSLALEDFLTQEFTPVPNLRWRLYFP